MILNTENLAYINKFSLLLYVLNELRLFSLKNWPNICQQPVRQLLFIGIFPRKVIVHHAVIRHISIAEKWWAASQKWLGIKFYAYCWKRRYGGMPVGYSGWITLKGEQCRPVAGQRPRDKQMYNSRSGFTDKHVSTATVGYRKRVNSVFCAVCA